MLTSHFFLSPQEMLPEPALVWQQLFLVHFASDLFFLGMPELFYLPV